MMGILFYLFAAIAIISALAMIFGRNVTHGVPSTVVSSCTPPESVQTNAAACISPTKST